MNASGRTVAKAHYGRYYRGVLTRRIRSTRHRRFRRATSSTACTTGGGTPEPGSAKSPTTPTCESIQDSATRTPTSSSWASIRELFRRGPAGELRPQTERRFRRVARRRGQYAPVQFTDTQLGAQPSGQTFTLQKLTSSAASRIFELRTDPRMTSRYDGLSIQVTKRLSSHWQGNLLAGALEIGRPSRVEPGSPDGRRRSSAGGVELERRIARPWGQSERLRELRRVAHRRQSRS